ncbi:hypothetical protein Taro_046521 [Colocasia esculenta]|uniref:Uncharacterized protein n=1 Tax=Colocasia esculenta TaxID=4460 RepID=A0A843WZC8_COLES|nr:hypothetical protein [Colocasia esculenta]
MLKGASVDGKAQEQESQLTEEVTRLKLDFNGCYLSCLEEVQARHAMLDLKFLEVSEKSTLLARGVVGLLSQSENETKLKSRREWWLTRVGLAKVDL